MHCASHTISLRIICIWDHLKYASAMPCAERDSRPGGALTNVQEGPAASGLWLGNHLAISKQQKEICN